MIFLANKHDKHKPAVKTRKFSESQSEKTNSKEKNFNNLKIVGVIILLIIAAFLLFDKLYEKKDIAAKVNGEEITIQNIEEQYNQMPLEYRNLVTKENILNQTINEFLLLQEAEKQGIKVTNDEVSETLNEVIKNSGLSEQEFEEVLEEQNLTMMYLEEYYKKLLTINKLIEEHVLNKISVSDEEMIEYYESNKNEFVVPEHVNASHILVNTTQEAEEILILIDQGDDFAELARERSQCTSAQFGGNLGPFTRGMMVKEFEDAAFSMEVGEISGIVESSFGYHIIKLHEKKPESTMSFQEAKPLIQEEITFQKQEQEIDEYLNKLKDQSEIIIFDVFSE